MVHIRECMRRWLPFVIMAASLGVSPAQDVASPDAADLDLDLVKLKSGPKGRQREAMRKVLLLVHLKQKETWLAESTGDEAVHLAAEISFRRYLASVDMDGCPEEFRRAFLRYAKLLNSFEEKDLFLKDVNQFLKFHQEETMLSRYIQKLHCFAHLPGVAYLPSGTGASAGGNESDGG